MCGYEKRDADNRPTIRADVTTTVKENYSSSNRVHW